MARARLTIVDVMNFGVGVFVLGLLIGPIYLLLNTNAAALGTGDAYLLRMVPPAILLTVLMLIIVNAVGRGA